MLAGFNKGRGSIFITVDSDTVIRKDALTYIITPLEDKEVAAASGSVLVANKKTNFLTRMLGIRYRLAFDLERASQASYGMVTCCSGVFSAYKASFIHSIKDEWVGQTFLGQVCTYGDDRALTNLAIREGYKTSYAQTAVSYTNVPTTVKKYLKMIARWNKSWIRESLVFMRFSWSKVIKRKRYMGMLDFTLTTAIKFAVHIYILLYIYLALTAEIMFIVKFFFFILLMSTVFMVVVFDRSDWRELPYGMVYSLFYITVVAWTFYYSLSTMKNSSWLTR